MTSWSAYTHMYALPPDFKIKISLQLILVQLGWLTGLLEPLPLYDPHPMDLIRRKSQYFNKNKIICSKINGREPERFCHCSLPN